MHGQICLDEVGLHGFVHRAIEQPERMNEAGVGTDHSLQFKSPIESRGRTRKSALESYDGLVEHRLIRAIVEKPYFAGR